MGDAGIRVLFDMPLLQRSFEIKARDFVRAGEASIEVQRILKDIGFDAEQVRRASICAYESEMNVVMHGGDGELVLTLNPEKIVLDISSGLIEFCVGAPCQGGLVGVIKDTAAINFNDVPEGETATRAAVNPAF